MHQVHASRLNQSTLAAVSAAVAAPAYHRRQLRPSIIHLGLGGFHRAHLATYIHELAGLGHTDWAIVGAGVLPVDATMAATLKAQDYLYTLITRGSDKPTVEIIGSIVDYIHAVPHAPQLINAIAAPQTQIVSLTITEGGYPVDDRTGHYDDASPVAGPASAFGLLAAGLKRRWESGGAGLTVLSCDNIVHNGAVARTATLGEAARIDERDSGGLVAWIEQSVTFPNSMVDRITPATTDSDRRWLAENYHIDDRWPVITEPFRQWVVEDRFGGDRPPLEQLDVVVTDDVEPYERIKLRMLNAAHSCMAYLSALANIETVDQAMANTNIYQFVDGFLQSEAQPSIPPAAGIDLDTYRASILERFANPGIGDQISRLCLDGTSKFPKFLLPTVRAQLAAGGPIELAALALAAWAEYLRGPADGLAADPLMAQAVSHAQRAVDEPAEFLAFTDVFGPDLPQAERFTRSFAHHLVNLRKQGVHCAIRTALDGPTGSGG